MSCARAQMYPAATAQMYLASSDPQILPPKSCADSCTVGSSHWGIRLKIRGMKNLNCRCYVVLRKKDNCIGIVPQYAQSGCVRAHSEVKRTGFLCVWKGKNRFSCVSAQTF